MNHVKLFDWIHLCWFVLQFESPLFYSFWFFKGFRLYRFDSTMNRITKSTIHPSLILRLKSNRNRLLLTLKKAILSVADSLDGRAGDWGSRVYSSNPANLNKSREGDFSWNFCDNQHSFNHIVGTCLRKQKWLFGAGVQEPVLANLRM